MSSFGCALRPAEGEEQNGGKEPVIRRIAFRFAISVTNRSVRRPVSLCQSEHFQSSQAGQMAYAGKNGR